MVVIAWCWVYGCVCFGGFYLGMFDMLLVCYCCFICLVWFGCGCLNVIALVFSFGFCCLFGWVWTDLIGGVVIFVFGWVL